jgi:hypothetical protein
MAGIMADAQADSVAGPPFTPVARVLPPEEWVEKGGPLAVFNPHYAFIIVVEDGGPGGTLLARWGATTVVHVEGLEETPEAQGHAGVSRALLTKMLEVLNAQAVVEVLTQAETPQVERMIQSAGGRQVPGTTWVIPLKDGR